MLFASLVPAISLADHSVQRDGASTTLLWSSLEARDGADKLSQRPSPKAARCALPGKVPPTHRCSEKRSGRNAEPGPGWAVVQPSPR
jgi:hypothetical protein